MNKDTTRYFPVMMRHGTDHFAGELGMSGGSLASRGRPNLTTGRLCWGGMEPLTDIAIDPAGNVWVADNWQRPVSCFAPFASEAKSTLCERNGLMVFYGVAKPVQAPQIWPSTWV
jgi:hypothetical protein